MFRKVFLIVASVVAPSVSAAQALGDTTIQLPPAIVEAARASGSASSPYRLTIIGPAAIESLPIRSVADALDKRTSVHVVRYGAAGMSTASIRGTGGKHTSVLLDGLLLSDPQSNQIDLALIPVVMLESIEVAHGPASATRGPGSLGGEIALKTLQAGDQARLKIGLEAGEFGQRRVGAAGATKAGRLSFTVAGEISENIGNYPFTNPTLIDPTEQRREGADKSSTVLYANATYKQGNHRISASSWINSVERGLPGPANAPPTDARQWDDHTRVWLKSEHHAGVWTAEASAIMHLSKLGYQNSGTATNEITETSTTEVQMQASRVFGSSWFATGGFKGSLDQSGEITERRLAAFGEATFESGRLIFYPSARLESWFTADDTQAFLIPRAGANVRILDSNNLHAKLNLGKAYRSPSFLERYWSPGGNPNLVPESGWSVDGGLHGTSGRSRNIQVEAGIFYTDLKNQISWFPSLVGSGVQVWRPFNVGRVVTYGTELSLDARARFGRSIFESGISSTLSRAEDRSDPSIPSYGKQLRYTPQIRNAVYAGITHSSITVTLSGRYVGQRFVTSDETRNMDAYVVFDAHLGYRIDLGGTSGSFAVQIENALNAQFSVVRFYPMPPRTVTLRVGFDF